MWVRSQDGMNLIKAEVFQIHEDRLNNDWYIKALTTSCVMVIARYKTGSMAKKILTRVQSYCYQNGVFQMPQDEITK